MYLELDSKGKATKHGSTTNYNNIKTVSQNTRDIERTEYDMKQKETVLKTGSTKVRSKTSLF
jgi:uncharacterized membrane protein YjjP (DUF1212 family)